MKKSVLVVLLCLIASNSFAQVFRTLDWKRDLWQSPNGHFLKYDKVEHCLGSTGLTISLTLFTEKNGWKYALLSGFLWEVKDGLMPYEKYGQWGGEGFSSKDFLADALGVVLGYGIYKGGKWLFHQLF